MSLATLRRQASPYQTDQDKGNDKTCKQEAVAPGHNER